MNYSEAAEYREKNLHLVGKVYNGFRITDVVIIPKERSLMDEFVKMYLVHRDSVKIAEQFPSKSFKLLVHVGTQNPGDFGWKELGKLPQDFKVVLPGNY